MFATRTKEKEKPKTKKYITVGFSYFPFQLSTNTLTTPPHHRENTYYSDYSTATCSPSQRTIQYQLIVNNNNNNQCVGQVGILIFKTFFPTTTSTRFIFLQKSTYYNVLKAVVKWWQAGSSSSSSTTWLSFFLAFSQLWRCCKWSSHDSSSSIVPAWKLVHFIITFFRFSKKPSLSLFYSKNKCNSQVKRAGCYQNYFRRQGQHHHPWLVCN